MSHIKFTSAASGVRKRDTDRCSATVRNFLTGHVRDTNRLSSHLIAFRGWTPKSIASDRGRSFLRAHIDRRMEPKCTASPYCRSRLEALERLNGESIRCPLSDPDPRHLTVR